MILRESRNLIEHGAEVCFSEPTKLCHFWAFFTRQNWNNVIEHDAEVLCTVLTKIDRSSLEGQYV